MSRKMKLDFTGVESFQRASEGKHICKIATADEKTSQGGNEMIVIAFEVVKGADKTARVYENYPLIDTALWKLKGLLQAIGMRADGKVQLDLDKLIGKMCEVTVKHEEYEGKTRARVDSVSKITVAEDDEDSEDDEEEEKPVKVEKKSSKKAPAAEDDDDWDDEEEDEAEEQEEPKKPVKKASKKAPMPEPEDDDDEDDDWGEEEEEEKPAPKKKPVKEEKKPAKADKKPAKKSKDDDDDWDDDDWDEEA